MIDSQIFVGRLNNLNDLMMMPAQEKELAAMGFVPTARRISFVCFLPTFDPYGIG